MADAIVYIVDITNKETLRNANEMLQNLCEIPYLKEKPLLIFGNKSDQPFALTDS